MGFFGGMNVSDNFISDKSHVSIHIASPSFDFDQIYKFRYAVYTSDLGYSFPESDHINKMLIDDFDDCFGVIQIYAINNNGEIVACIRANKIHTSNINSNAHRWFNMKIFIDNNINELYFISRLLIRKDYRKTNLLIWQLTKKLYSVLEFSVLAAIGDCSPHLVEFYKRIGWFPYHNDFFHPVLGWKTPLIMIFNNYEILRQSRSLLAPLAWKRSLSELPLNIRQIDVQNELLHISRRSENCVNNYPTEELKNFYMIVHKCNNEVIPRKIVGNLQALKTFIIGYFLEAKPVIYQQFEFLDRHTEQILIEYSLVEFNKKAAFLLGKINTFIDKYSDKTPEIITDTQEFHDEYLSVLRQIQIHFTDLTDFIEILTGYNSLIINRPL
ncbi:MAG: GNAT family N-acetyltransferase [Magnetococcales bacterium]|nr:GNAT family N-acetyltransferase [Magnetococcales bacterium]